MCFFFVFLIPNDMKERGTRLGYMTKMAAILKAAILNSASNFPVKNESYDISNGYISREKNTAVFYLNMALFVKMSCTVLGSSINVDCPPERRHNVLSSTL